MAQFDYENELLLHSDDFDAGFDQWHHEGVGEIKATPAADGSKTSGSGTGDTSGGGGMRLHCLGSQQGREGCMAFFRPDLPDLVAYEYDLTIRSQGGLVINYLAIRGMRGEDMIADADKLKPRTGIMGNYFATRWGLQSYHVSVSRFNDKGEHSGTCNWRRNPGMVLVGHGMDLVTEIDRTFHIRITKDQGHCQLYVDGVHAHGFVDRDTARGPIPDTGKFGFRLIGSDVMADIEHFRVYKLKPNPGVWGDASGFQGFGD